MKLTIKHKDTVVIYDEAGNEQSGKDRISSIRWEDQSKIIFELIQTISKEIQELNK